MRLSPRIRRALRRAVLLMMNMPSRQIKLPYVSGNHVMRVISATAMILSSTSKKHTSILRGQNTRVTGAIAHAKAVCILVATH